MKIHNILQLELESEIGFTIQETASGDRNIERKNVVHKGETQNLK